MRESVGSQHYSGKYLNGSRDLIRNHRGNDKTQHHFSNLEKKKIYQPSTLKYYIYL